MITAFIKFVISVALTCPGRKRKNKKTVNAAGR